VSDLPPSASDPDARSRDELCLVTGATGFIGGRLTQRLVEEGHAVRCLVRAGSDTSQLDGLGVQLAVGDLTDAGSIPRAVQGCSHVFHCAALVSDWATVAEMQRVNVAGTRDLAAACAGASVRRLVHFSTTDVYGHPAEAVDEKYTPTGFSNWYAQTKLEAEEAVRRVEPTGALEAVILRPATVYGPGSKDVIGEIARAIRGGHMLLIDRGRAVAGLCYVDNVVDAALLALRHDAAPGHAFNVTDGLAVTWRRLADDLAAGLGCPPVRWSIPYRFAAGVGFALEHGYRLVRRATGVSVPPLLSRQAVQVLGRSQDFSNRRIRETLGWEPRVGYAEGLAATLAWLGRDSTIPAV
jgi:nucleoside-diphosphate-sugar epimerase